MKVIEIPKDQSIDEALCEFQNNSGRFDCVMLIALNKDGSQFMRVSNANMMEKSFMVAFAQSWLMNWFKGNYE